MEDMEDEDDDHMDLTEVIELRGRYLERVSARLRYLMSHISNTPVYQAGVDARKAR